MWLRGRHESGEEGDFGDLLGRPEDVAGLPADLRACDAGAGVSGEPCQSDHPEACELKRDQGCQGCDAEGDERCAIVGASDGM